MTRGRVESAIERAIAKKSPTTLELDAEELARVAIKLWGDDAPRVLGRAIEHARTTVSAWVALGASNAASGADAPEK